LTEVFIRGKKNENIIEFELTSDASRHSKKTPKNKLFLMFFIFQR